MKSRIYDSYTAILKSELVPALGCTEPIAIAYAAATARKVLGCMPEHMEISCSGNIIKNVAGVIVPNTNGLKGVNAAGIIGVIGGDAEAELEVLKDLTPWHIEKTKEYMETDFCSVRLVEGVENLYIEVKVYANCHSAIVEVSHNHTHISRIIKDGQVLLEQPENAISFEGDKSLLNVKDILFFASTVCINEVKHILDRQIKMNTEITTEGLTKQYGLNVGKTLLQFYYNDVKTRAIAKAAAGSDARMGGCSMPVVINSGSGNQGITVSIPVIEYAREYNYPKEKLYRALIIANLIAIHQKRFIGKLSSYCGAVSAACGAVCGIAYLNDADYNVISKTIINTICNVGGIVCDGAKPSCASKIASAINAGFIGYHLAYSGKVFINGEGLVKEDVEKTIEAVGRMAKNGMASTDIEILNIMLSP